MEILIEYWYLIIGGMAVLASAGYCVYNYAQLTTSEQLEKVRQWLLYAVIEAEAALGSGTGEVKLRYVYDLFIGKFPWLVEALEFDVFSDLVDDALEEMRELLSSNEDVEKLVMTVEEE